MERPCYRCQAMIEEGVAFCPHCGAPQIRVASAEDGTPPATSATPNPPGEFPSPSQPSSWSPGAGGFPPGPNAIRWELAWPGALMAGAGAAILTAIPYVSLGCCLWMLGAGALSVALYQKRMGGLPVTPGMGMKLGALAGIFGFAINASLTTVLFVVLRSHEFRQALNQQMEKSIAANPDPKAQEIMQRMVNWIASPQGMATFMVMLLLIVGVFFLLFTAAGGALGASMFGRRREFR